MCIIKFKYYFDVDTKYERILLYCILRVMLRVISIYIFRKTLMLQKKKKIAGNQNNQC